MSDFIGSSNSRQSNVLLCAFAPLREVFSILILLICVCAVPGCVGYQVGAGSLYAPDVATVYVPMIDSER